MNEHTPPRRHRSRRTPAAHAAGPQGNAGDTPPLHLAAADGGASAVDAPLAAVAAETDSTVSHVEPAIDPGPAEQTFTPSVSEEVVPADATGVETEAGQVVGLESDVLAAEPVTNGNGSHVADTLLTDSLVLEPDGTAPPPSDGPARYLPDAETAMVAAAHIVDRESAPPAVAGTAAPVRTTPRRTRWVTRLLAGVFADAGTAVLLCGIALLFFRALWFTGEIGSDPLLMRSVYPARQFIASALRENRLPLWNPYLFTGVPFLADPESGALYPGNLALRWLDAPDAVALSVTAHVLLGALGMVVFTRGAFRLGRLSALTGALVFGFGGVLGANAVEPRVVEAAAWMPWVLAAAHLAYRRWLLGGVALGGLVLGIQALAGDLHISTLTLAAVAVLLLVSSLADAAAFGRGSRIGPRGLPVMRAAAVSLLLPLLAAGIAAPALLPAWELLQRSPHAKGLPSASLAAGSLRPEQIVRALLPGFNEDPARRLIAHGGIIALGLALVALRRPGRAAAFGVTVALLGLMAALGDNNPLRHKVSDAAPRWVMFEYPTRALALWALGIAVLAAVGLDRLDRAAVRRASMSPRFRRPWVVRGAVAVGAPCAAALLVRWMWPIDLPSSGVREIWIGLGVMAVDVAVLLPLLRPRRWIAAVLVVAVAAELVVAGSRLPFTRTASPAVFEVSATLAGAVRGQDAPERVGRLDGMAEQDAAPAPGFERFTPERAGRDRLAPNAAMLDRVATLEGLRGPLLPTRDFLEAIASAATLPARTFQSPDDLPETVGALGDQASGLLGPRLGVTHILAPPPRSVRAGAAEFVLGGSVDILPGQETRIGLEGGRVATGIALLTELTENVAAGQPVAELSMVEAGGEARRRTLFSGAEVGTGPEPPAGRAVDVGAGHAATLAEQPLGRAAAFRVITIRNVLSSGVLRLHGVALTDDRSGAAVAVPLNQDLRPVMGASVSVLADTRTPPRASLVRSVSVNPDTAATRRALSVLPPDVVVLDRAPVSVVGDARSVPVGLDNVRITSYQPERVDVLVTAASPAVLVLRDSDYPGWEARVDGVRTPILRADGLFRAVEVPEGTHTVVFQFRPRGLMLGGWIAAGTLVLMAAMLFGSLPWLWVGKRRALGLPARDNEHGPTAEREPFDTPQNPTLD